MENKNGSSLFARQCLAEALIGLMGEKDYQEISLTEICRTAGFSRMAYYRNFKSKDDILVTYMKMLADKFREDVLKKLPDASSRSYELILYAFQYFRNYRRFAECLLQANLSSILQYGLNYYMDTFVAGEDAGKKKRYTLYYYSGGLYNLFSVWVMGGMEESAEEMAQVVYERINPGTAPGE